MSVHYKAGSLAGNMNGDPGKDSRPSKDRWASPFRSFEACVPLDGKHDGGNRQNLPATVPALLTIRETAAAVPLAVVGNQTSMRYFFLGKVFKHEKRRICRNKTDRQFWMNKNNSTKYFFCCAASRFFSCIEWKLIRMINDNSNQSTCWERVHLVVDNRN